MTTKYTCPEQGVTLAPLTPKGFMDAPSGSPSMLIVTGWPHKDELSGGMNHGKAKRILLQMMRHVGIPEHQVAFAPLLCFRPDVNREPTPAEVEHCRSHLAEYIDDLQPNIILTMGVPAFDGCHEPLSIYMNRGDLFKSKHFGRKLMPTYSPGIVLREWNKRTVIEHDLRRAWEQAQSPDFPLMLGEDYFVCTEPAQVEAALDYLATRPIVSFDIETEGFDLFEQDEILCVQISSKAGEGFVIPLRGAWALHEEDTYADWQLEHGEWRMGHAAGTEVGAKERVLFDKESLAVHDRDKRRQTKVYSPVFPKGSVVCRTPNAHNPFHPAYEKKGHICRGTLTNVLAGPLEPCTAQGRMNGKLVPRDYNVIVAMLADWLEGSTPKAAQNGKFDVHGLKYQLGIRVHNFVFDTILAYHIISEEWPHDLDTIRSFLTWMPRYNEKLKSYVPSKKHSFALVPNEVLWYYGAADADCEFRIIEPLMEWLRRDNPEDGEWLFANIAMPLQRALTQIEENGIVVNTTRLADLSQWYREKIAALRSLLNEMCAKDGYTPVEAWSNDNQLREWLYNAEYDKEVRKGTLHVCKTCHGNWQYGPDREDDDCTECIEGKVPGREAEVVSMRGINFPEYIAWRSKKTGDPSTGKKSVAALRGWCHEDYRYVFKEAGHRKDGTPITKRVITTKPVSKRGKALRSRMFGYLDAIEQLKRCIKAKNQFLDGDDSKDVVGAKALLAHIKSDGKVHTSYNQLVETARLSCVPLTAQILTAEGWKTHDQLTPGESVLGWDVLNRRYEWTPLQQVHRGQARLGTLQYRHPTTKGRSRKKFYPRSTANHKWVIDDGRISGFAESSMLRGLTVRLAAAQPAPSGDSNVTPDEAAIVGWLITDGWVMNREVQNRPNPSAAVSLNKPKSVAALRALLKPYPHTEHARTKTTTFYIGTSYYRQLMARCNLDGRRLKEESLEPFILALSQESRASMYEAMMEADGSRTRVHQERFGALSASVSKESFLLLCALLGRFTTAGDRPLGNKKPFTDFHVWQVPSTRRIVFTEDDTESEVWCPQTALGTWVMRQNDEVFITGNSRGPNLQNITNTAECTPHQEEGVRCPPGCPGEYRHYSIRSMFTVRPGSKWLAADYRSEEVRIMAYLSGDMKLLTATMTCYGPKGVGGCGEIFMATEDDPERPLKMLVHERESGHVPADVHQWVASQVFGVPYDAVTREQRRQCKSVTFGIAYGQSEMGLADALGWAVERAAELIALYFKTFPDLSAYQKANQRATAQGADSVNALGRKRHTVGPVEMRPFVRDWDWKKVVGAMQRERLNYPTQSTAAEVISLDTVALADVWGYEDGADTVAHRLGRKLCGGDAPALVLRDLDVLVINSVHDALEFDCPEGAVEQASRIIEAVMVGIPWRILGFYLPVDITVGRYWDDTGAPSEWSEQWEEYYVSLDEVPSGA